MQQKRTEAVQVAPITGSTIRVKGLRELLEQLQSWPEVNRINVGRISPNPRNRGGGFRFRATRYAVNKGVECGIRCLASNGVHTQDVYLMSDAHKELKERLQDEGLCGKW